MFTLLFLLSFSFPTFLFASLYSSSADAEGCKRPAYLSLEYFNYVRVSEFVQVKSDAISSFNLMVVITRSYSLPMSTPWKDLVFTLLMLDLKPWGVRMKSIWL